MVAELMGALIMLYLIYYVTVYGVGWFCIRVLPLLCEWLLTLLVALFQGVFSALGYIMRALWVALRTCGRGIRLAMLFAFFLVSEWLRPSADESDEAASQHEGEDNAASTAPDAYGTALALFGLRPGFSRTALHAAYKQAIRAAHPDLGGSTEEAQAINAARDLIMRRHGWA